MCSFGEVIKKRYQPTSRYVKFLLQGITIIIKKQRTPNSTRYQRSFSCLLPSNPVSYKSRRQKINFVDGEISFLSGLRLSQTRLTRQADRKTDSGWLLAAFAVLVGYNPATTTLAHHHHRPLTLFLGYGFASNLRGGWTYCREDVRSSAESHHHHLRQVKNREPLTGGRRSRKMTDGRATIRSPTTTTTTKSRITLLFFFFFFFFYL